MVNKPFHHRGIILLNKVASLGESAYACKVNPWDPFTTLYMARSPNSVIAFIKSRSFCLSDSFLIFVNVLFSSSFFMKFLK